MIVKKEKKGDVMIYIVREDMTEAKIDKRASTKLTEKDREKMTIIDHDADVFIEGPDGQANKLLIRFRKNKLSKEKVDTFWDNVIQFARKDTSNRGSASGSKIKNVGNNPKIKTKERKTIKAKEKEILTLRTIKLRKKTPDLV